jgi:hypothetical protein
LSAERVENFCPNPHCFAGARAVAADEIREPALEGLDRCPRCGAARLLPVVRGMAAERFCLSCKKLSGRDGSLLD